MTSQQTLDRPRILCVMRMPPDPDGHGGSQRAWHLLHALRQIGEVDFVLVYRGVDADCVNTSLEPVRPLVRSVTRIDIAGWQPTYARGTGIVPGSISTFLRMRSQEAPELSKRELAEVAARLPACDPQIIFAGRLCSAYITEALIREQHLSAPLKVVDFDDVMSKFGLRRANTSGSHLAPKTKLRMRFDAFWVARAERRIADAWHAVSVCTDEDVRDLEQGGAARAVVKIPNAVLRPRLPPRTPDGEFRLLFAGNLGFAPNIDGLRVFVEKAWPRLQAAAPRFRLSIVGMNPDATVRDLARRHALPLHSNVPSLTPFYAECDAVIAPILFGSGTRIKILEAMAYGRPVVSTSLGAEGMHLVDGEHILLADDMDAFATAVIRLADDSALATSVTEAAHRYQQTWYTPAAIDRGVRELIDRGRRSAGL